MGNSKLNLPTTWTKKKIVSVEKNKNVTSLTLELPKEVKEELEKDLKYLENITKKPRSFHVKEALVRYIEDMEDIRDVREHIKNKNKNTKYYTSEELKKKLDLK